MTRAELPYQPNGWQTCSPWPTLTGNTLPQVLKLLLLLQKQFHRREGGSWRGSTRIIVVFKTLASDQGLLWSQTWLHGREGGEGVWRHLRSQRWQTQFHRREGGSWRGSTRIIVVFKTLASDQGLLWSQTRLHGREGGEGVFGSFLPPWKRFQSLQLSAVCSHAIAGLLIQWRPEPFSFWDKSEKILLKPY